MRFMMIVKGNEASEAGAMPTEEMLSEMGKYNEELAKAGVMLAMEGLHPSSKGARIAFHGRKPPKVTDGPFAEAKELIAGYWLIQVKSREEAIEWAKRVPYHEGALELRQVFESDDFGEEFTPELREQEDRIRDQIAAKA